MSSEYPRIFAASFLEPAYAGYEMMLTTEMQPDGKPCNVAETESIALSPVWPSRFRLPTTAMSGGEWWFYSGRIPSHLAPHGMPSKSSM